MSPPNEEQRHVFYYDADSNVTFPEGWNPLQPPPLEQPIDLSDKGLLDSSHVTVVLKLIIAYLCSQLEPDRFGTGGVSQSQTK